MDREEYLQKCSNMKCQRVQVKESFVPSLQDEVMEVEHLRAEPRNDQVSVNGSLDSHTTLNDKDDLGLEVLDGFLDDFEIDDLDGTDGFLDGVEMDDLEGAAGFSDACGGYFFDFEFANKAEVLGSSACEGSLLQSSNSESPSSGFSGSSAFDGISESSKVHITQSKFKNESQDETVTYDTHGVLRSNPSQPSNVDCMYDISLDTQHLYELNNVYPLAGGILSCEKENFSVEKCQSAPTKEKRSRKPTKRYIEESSNLRSKEKVPATGTENKWTVSPCDELHTRIKGLKKNPGEKSSYGNRDVTFSELKPRKGRPKKQKLEYANEPLPSESEDKCLRPKTSRRKDRRKNQRMWTVSEVTKLVDGISEYGVGRWTDIKRSLFSSSSYRTPMDIRDKWRNLLRASSAQKFNKKEAEEDDKCALRPLSYSVARRVCELAKLYPYPRQRGSKKSFNSQVDSSVIASQSKGSPSLSNRLVRRNVRRKNFT